MKQSIEKLALVVALGTVLAPMSQAQIPDLVTAMDAGGRSMGMGGALDSSSTSTQSGLNNPAGLAYISQPTLNLGLRSLRESRTVITNNFNDPDLRTRGLSGNKALSHLGYAIPAGKHRTLAFTYTLGGFIKDTRTGTNLADGVLTVRDYVENLRSKTDYFTISLGQSNESMTRSFGYGLVMASQNIRNQQSYRIFRADNTEVGSGVVVDNAGQSFGLGLVVGMQMSPGGNPDQVIGASIRTPISLQGGTETKSYLGRLPGKASLSFAQRTSNPGRASDFILLGLQGDLYFGGEENKVISRKATQLVLGAGIEYNYRLGNSAYLPIRFGFKSIGKGGTGYSSTSGITFGLGFLPDKGNYGFNLDFGTSSVGGGDSSLELTYRLKK